jgi:hypothetical protein
MGKQLNPGPSKYEAGMLTIQPHHLVWDLQLEITCFENQTNKLHGLSSRANYTGRDRRLSAKLLPTFADRGMSRSQRGGSHMATISDFLTGAATFSSK